MNGKHVYSGYSLKLLRFVRKLMTAAFVLMVSSMVVHAFQPGTITGKVVDEAGEPLTGVTVIIKGTTQGAVTGANGNYSISGISDNTVLVFSFIGMETQELVVGNQTSVNVTMKSTAIGLQEVVAIGYGNMKKRNLTGAVSSVDMETLETRTVKDIGEVLAGQIAGVQVVQHTGSPGAAPTIQVRGLNSITAGQVPLLVIDGVPQVNMMDLSVVNPMNIESIEVLKDASAASIYGSRANAGVILVTTKGTKSGVFTLNASYKASVQQLPRKVPVMNAQEYIEAMKAAAQNGWVYFRKGDPNAPNTVAARGHIRYTWPEEWDDPNVVANWPSTDLQDYWYQDAPMHQVDLSGAGGTESLKYNISGSFLDQEGMINNGNHYNRIHLSGKLESKVNDWFRLGMNMNSRYSIHKKIPEWWVFEQHTIEMPPLWPIFTKEGYAGGPSTLAGDSRYPATNPGINKYESIYFTTAANPATYLNDNEQQTNNKSLGTLWAEFALLKDLKFRSSYTYDLEWTEQSLYRSVNRNLPASFNQSGSLSRNWNKTYHWYLSNVLTFDKSFGENELNVTAGFDAEKTNRLGFSAVSSGYANDFTPYLNSATAPTSNGDNESATTFKSYFARAIYTLKDRYIINGSFRYDGSSRFGSDNKWGVFPSAGLGWIMSNEGFMETVSLINILKLRASYGFTGNDSFGDYIWIPTLSQGSTAIGGQLTNFYQKGSLPNPALRWEKTGMLNVGFDLSIMNSRINLTADYYNSKTDDLLLSLPVSSLTGFNSLLQNVGSIKNSGIELNLNTQNTIGDFKWNTILTFGRNTGKATDLGGEEYVRPAASFGFEVRVYEDGEDLFQYYAYDYIGTYRDQADIDASPSYPGAEPGDAKYRDIDGDGEITTDDRTILGTMMPDFTASMTNTFQWKGLDLNVLLTSVVGGEKVNVFRRRGLWYQGGRNFLKLMNDAWSPENPDSYYFKPSVNVNSWNTRPSSYWMESATYLKIQSVTLGYSLENETLRQLGISRFRLFLSGENLYSFDNFIGYNTDQGSGGNKHYTRGFTHNEYAIPRIYTAGINLTF